VDDDWDVPAVRDAGEGREVASRLNTDRALKLAFHGASEP
jgi:hypothetical protein